jgi:4-diphosphocytidyl-2-C-methyl-D-erythritol kinase
MTVYEAPAKLNLSLLVSPPRSDGYHPLESLVQTIEWCDRLEIVRGEGRDELDSDIDDNLVLMALRALRQIGDVPPLAMSLDKEIPIAAGMGGGSADAAAALVAGAETARIPRSRLGEVAWKVGADVAFFLEGGTAVMRGIGDELEAVQPADGFAVAVVVPEFGLLTEDVYARWDVMEGPVGNPVPEDELPPSLRGRIPMRNDLLPAALDVEPLLGDFMADVAAIWGTMACLTGSGSACFGYFATLDEATDAAAAVSPSARVSRGVTLRDRGVNRMQ